MQPFSVACLKLVCVGAVRMREKQRVVRDLVARNRSVSACEQTVRPRCECEERSIN